MYKLTKSIPPSNDPFSVLRLEDGACIPFAEANTDYQEYLKWIEEGNEPLPADEPAE